MQLKVEEKLPGSSIESVPGLPEDMGTQGLVERRPVGLPEQLQRGPQFSRSYAAGRHPNEQQVLVQAPNPPTVTPDGVPKGFAVSPEQLATVRGQLQSPNLSIKGSVVGDVDADGLKASGAGDPKFGSYDTPGGQLRVSSRIGQWEQRIGGVPGDSPAPYWLTRASS